MMEKVVILIFLFSMEDLVIIHIVIHIKKIFMTYAIEEAVQIYIEIDQLINIIWTVMEEIILYIKIFYLNTAELKVLQILIIY